MGMKSQGHNAGRLVYDAAYFVGVLRRRISDVNTETVKLRTEIDQQSKDNSQYAQLERRYEDLLKNKETLEGKLADYNLALDKVSLKPSNGFVSLSDLFCTSILITCT